MNEIFNGYVDFLLESLDRRKSKNLRNKTALAVTAVITTAQNRLLQIETSPIEQKFSEQYLQQELAKMLVVYVESV